MKYNDEPVEYCENCKSLHLVDMQGLAICNDCGTVGFTKHCSIEEYIKKYGVKEMED